VTLALTRVERSALFVVSAAAYIASFSGTQGKLHAQSAPDNPIPTTLVVHRVRSVLVSSAIRRDPFAGDLPLTSGLVHTERMLDPQVPDIIEEAAPPHRSSDVYRLKATITGRNAIAYVQSGSAIEILRVGDVMGERTVKSIALDGITFSDGSHLGLVQHESPVLMATTSASFAARIALLRHLLISSLRAVRPASRQSPPPAPILPTALPTYPAPSGLPTIVPYVLPVGVSPTSDANGPTPYPLPPLRPNY